LQDAAQVESLAIEAIDMDVSSIRPRADQVVIVTGCSSGIGKCIAERLARKNIAVYGGSRRVCHPASWAYAPLDVTNQPSVDAFVAGVLRRENRVDALIACAGTGLAGAVEDTADEEAWRQLDVNFFGTTRIIRAFLPVMRRQRHGKIIVVGSIGGLIGLPFTPYYSASKFALDGLVEALRGEIAPFGIEATILHPGDVNTEFGKNRVIARNAGAGSVYENDFRRTLRFYAGQEDAAPPPQAVARTVARLLARRHLPVRVISGSPLEHLGVFGKAWLPGRLFEYVMRKVYGPRDEHD
jgi:NAD(P)-dependent dehydrogenase (short-subunit alcohol dehydrogenase family)